jgi:hypothetical protein
MSRRYFAMTTQDKLIKAKLNMLDLADYLGNVSEACRRLGYSLAGSHWAIGGNS